MKPMADRKAQLTEGLAAVNTRLRRIEGELTGHQSKDREDLATEREDDEVLEGMGKAGQHEIRQIEAALARMEAGTYGSCTVCGERIAEERLDLLPYTPFCRVHAG